MKTLDIDCKHAGGNIKVISMDESSVKLEQDIRDTTAWWFYWNFSVKSSCLQQVTFEFMNGEVIGPWGPAISKDGIQWDWLGEKSLISREKFIYHFNTENEVVYFSFGLPYQLHHFEHFYSQINGHPNVHRKLLAISEQLRSVPLLLVGNENSDQHIVLTGRHHSCESTPSYVLEGLLAYFLQESSTILDQFLIHYVPFVDIDGVENGDQGKCRAPHDHNQDYTDDPIYSATSAVMKYVQSLPLQVGIDFHGPYKWGDGISRHNRNNYPFFVKPASPRKEETEKFGRYLKRMTQQNQDGIKKLSYDPIYDIEKGDGWNMGSRGTCSHLFVSQHAKLAFSFEFPYFGTKGEEITPQKSREFGADFARALEHYLLG